MKNSILNDNWIFLKPISWPKLKKRINKQLERADKVIARSDKVVAKVESERLRSEAKMEAEKLTSINNSRNLPSNATISEEYVRCGKSDCPRCKHGPYYYAYWKDDKGKLHKRYIGKYPRPVENTKFKSSDMDHAPSDTAIDPSNSTEDV
jgi:hypothetical protein